MAVTTTIARHFYWWQIIVAVVCLVFSVWGAYDLWVKIPHQKEVSYIFNAHDNLSELREKGIPLNPLEIPKLVDLIPTDYPLKAPLSDNPTGTEVFAALDQITDEITRETPPGVYDALVQWMFISCIIFVPYSFWRIRSVNNAAFILDDEGNLTLSNGQTWARDDIASIDMSRWMAKSIAWVVHTDGTKFKMDAYILKDLELIIGEIAHRFEPEKWNPDGKEVKAEAEEEDDDIANDLEDDFDDNSDE